MTPATDPQALRQRIEAVYMAIGRRDNAHGALSWFARQAHVEPKTVSRWVNGRTDVAGPAIGLLEALEREAGITRDGR